MIMFFFSVQRKNDNVYVVYTEQYIPDKKLSQNKKTIFLHKSKIKTTKNNRVEFS